MNDNERPVSITGRPKTDYEIETGRDYDAIRAEVYKKFPKDVLVKQLMDFYDENLDPYELSDKGKQVNYILLHFMREVQYKAKNIRAQYTPDEVLTNPEIMDIAMKKIDSKPTYYNLGSDQVNLRSFFTNEASLVSKVATFSPNLARKVYEAYCPIGGVVYDYSCGWGARLLGCLGSKYNFTYFGTDPNSELNEKLWEEAAFIRETLDIPENRVDIRCQGSEFFVPEWEGKVDLSFSSPPYFNVEKYCLEDTQSSTVNDTYDAWINEFIIPTVDNIWRYTKPGGYCLINLKNLTKSFGGHLAFNDWVGAAVNRGFKLVDMRIMFYQSSRQFGTSSKTGKKRQVNFMGDKEPVGVLYKPKDGEEVRNLEMLYSMPFEVIRLNEEAMKDKEYYDSLRMEE